MSAPFREFEIRPGPQHFATIAHPLVAALQPRTEHTVTTDPMPVFTIKAKDALSLDAVDHYMALCQQRGLHQQAAEVWKAREEIREWQERNPDALKLPDHPHVPVRAA